MPQAARSRADHGDSSQLERAETAACSVRVLCANVLHPAQGRSERRSGGTRAFPAPAPGAAAPWTL
eukprot:4248990-Alexandrium_andersonii.AAC.1